jgi:2-polyprenyl-3-methyl-5-hydroxy-6-metoxy-1,4-benzoquinol methylase
MDAAILDLGCGNGHVCELLLALGFTKYMCLPHAPLYVYV